MSIITDGTVINEAEEKLPVPMKPERILRLADEISGLGHEISLAKEDLRTHVAKVRKEIKALEVKRLERTEEISSRQELVITRVATVHMPGSDEVRRIRVDTGEVIETRAITEAERQTLLPGTEEGRESDEG